MADELAGLRARAADLEARIKAARNVIAYGYPGKGALDDKCEHGRLGVEDCIGCYDEALLNALDGVAIESGKADVT